MRHTEVELGLKKIITEIYQREREREMAYALILSL